MQLHHEDPHLTAYVLGELTPEQAAAIELAAASDPALRAEIDRTRHQKGFLVQRLAMPAVKLLPSQYEKVRHAARKTSGSGLLTSFTSLKRTLHPWIIPTAAAAVLSLATLILIRMSVITAKSVVKADPPAASKTLENLRSPSHGPAHPTSQADRVEPIKTQNKLPSLVRRESISAADFPTLELPVKSGKASMDSISKAISIDNKRPSPSTVHLEEILNSFRFRLSGTTAIARGAVGNWHPDTRDSGVTEQVATLSTEMIACPWKPSSVLLLVSIRGNTRRDCNVQISYQAETSNVSRYRLLGYAQAEGNTTDSLPNSLPASTTTVLALEIEPLKPGVPLGSLVWSADGKPAPSISLTHKSETEPSDDARFAALVCTYAQWLAEEQIGVIDADIVAALARENATTSLPADRSDFLNLIDRSLNL